MSDNKKSDPIKHQYISKGLKYKLNKFCNQSVHYKTKLSIKIQTCSSKFFLAYMHTLRKYKYLTNFRILKSV